MADNRTTAAQIGRLAHALRGLIGHADSMSDDELRAIKRGDIFRSDMDKEDAAAILTARSALEAVSHG